jgi:cytoskeletal protein CcmA (bactofilin family)
MQINNDAQRGPAAFSPISGNGPKQTSYLGPGLEIKGEISGNEDLKLDSKVEGRVLIGGFRVTLGPQARVQAEIVAREAVISGEITGDVRASDRIEIKKDASVIGDLKTGKIMVEEGAFVRGTIEIDRHASPIGADLDSLLAKSERV